MEPTFEETVTPAPVPSRTAAPTDHRDSAESPGTGAALVVRNESAYRRTFVANILDDDTRLAERRATVLGGRGVTFSGVLPKTYGVIGDDPTTIRLETTDRRLIAERDVVVTRDVTTVVATLGTERVEWAVVEA